ncbi:MAG: carbohydrate-binding family 9-like protein [Balneolaceae bacterium]|nr:MAG: carbohydrate-binding family 9-like protein [Balneolaceae bacterium]
MNSTPNLMNNQNTTIEKKSSCKTLSILIVFILLSPYFSMSQELGSPAIPFSPETYVVHKIDKPLIIDGNIHKSEWQMAAWTNSFQDIRGSQALIPRYETRAKMLWDDQYFYFAALLEEPHIWATITERDAVIFMDNNFEIFIDPNGDTHHYYELEVNALGTFWDLMLTKPYRNGGRAINAWDIKGLKIGIDIQGTLNDPTDIDTSWSVEIAIPWDVLMETAPGSRPSGGDQWRVNFSRVQWQTDIVDGNYVKRTNPETGEVLPEDNWSWSPQGLINMHYPEMWGFVQFSELPAGTGEAEFEWNPEEDYKWLLRKLYYRQNHFRKEHGRFADQPDQLQFNKLFETLFDEQTAKPDLIIKVLDNNYIMRLSSDDLDHIFYIRNDSRVWKSEQ